MLSSLARGNNKDMVMALVSEVDDIGSPEVILKSTRS